MTVADPDAASTHSQHGEAASYSSWKQHQTNCLTGFYRNAARKQLEMKIQTVIDEEVLQSKTFAFRWMLAAQTDDADVIFQALSKDYWTNLQLKETRQDFILKDGSVWGQ